MKPIGWLLLVVAVAFGCTRPDWIERTLVTVDVTGVWEGTTAKTAGYQINLEQQGSQVKGFILNTGRASCANIDPAGPVEGSVAGDVFTFRQTNGPFTGEMTVSGDEMTGGGSAGCGRFQITLRRVNAASGTTSPKP